jgi:hypothetical protein
MEEFAKVVAALSGFAWPAAILSIGFYFRSQIQSLFQLARQQLASGAAIKWKDFELKGMEITSFDAKDGRGFRQEPADRVLFDHRHESYRDNKNLFLVHRVRATGQIHAVTSMPTFDVSVYLFPHKNFGYLNKVRAVEYYFGKYFGRKLCDLGTKYVVENGTDGFAVRVNAYGPMLCEARILFHDGTETTVSRYLDFEGTSYRFKSETNAADVENLKRSEELPKSLTAVD